MRSYNVVRSGFNGSGRFVFSSLGIGPWNICRTSDKYLAAAMSAYTLCMHFSNREKNSGTFLYEQVKVALPRILITDVADIAASLDPKCGF